MCIGIDTLMEDKKIERVVFVTVRSDVLEWLNPSWVYYSETGKLDLEPRKAKHLQINVGTSFDPMHKYCINLQLAFTGHSHTCALMHVYVFSCTT